MCVCVCFVVIPWKMFLLAASQTASMVTCLVTDGPPAAPFADPSS